MRGCLINRDQVEFHWLLWSGSLLSLHVYDAVHFPLGDDAVFDHLDRLLATFARSENLHTKFLKWCSKDDPHLTVVTFLPSIIFVAVDVLRMAGASPGAPDLNLIVVTLHNVCVDCYASHEQRTVHHHCRGQQARLPVACGIARV
jgi:hypothetical protein